MVAKTNRQEESGVRDAAHRPARRRTDIAQRAWHTGRVPLFEANGIVHDVGAKACVGTAIAFAAARDAALGTLPRIGVVDADQRAAQVDAQMRKRGEWPGSDRREQRSACDHPRGPSSYSTRSN